MSDELIRTRKWGVWEPVHSDAWGSMAIPFQNDPEGFEIELDILKSFRMIDDFPKMPSYLWGAVVELFFHLCGPEEGKRTEQNEVSVIFLRSKDDNYRTWRVLVPEQKVTAVQVKAKFDKLCDIMTGEEVTDFPPEGWVHAGSAHSHNRMGAFFSEEDDKSELSVPGLHIVLGEIEKGEKKSYKWNASIVLRGSRRYVNLNEVVDAKYRNGQFHQNVLGFIEKPEESKKMSKKEKKREKYLTRLFSGCFGRGRYADDDGEADIETRLSEEELRDLRDEEAILAACEEEFSKSKHKDTKLVLRGRDLDGCLDDEETKIVKVGDIKLLNGKRCTSTKGMVEGDYESWTKGQISSIKAALDNLYHVYGDAPPEGLVRLLKDHNL